MQVNQQDLIYLDHAAATPIAPHVLEAMTPYFSELFFNPSSPYAPAVGVRREYEEAKQQLAECIGAKKDELVMTAGATESINLAFSMLDGAAHVVTSEIEHHAVLAAAQKYPHTLVQSTEKGVITPESIAVALKPETQLVSVALANNELGTVQPIKKIAAACEAERERRAKNGETVPLFLHVDGSQGAGLIDIHVAKLGIDMLTLNAGKVYGPKQVGLLWARPQINLTPTIVGGGQEGGLRSGTENVAGTIGFAAALQFVEKRRKSEVYRLEGLRKILLDALSQKFPDMIVSGHPKKRLPSHLHISFPGLDAERLIFRLEARGVLVATGSACAANQGTRSHVLTAIGMSSEVADGSLRLSLGGLSDEKNTQRAATILSEEIAGEYARMKR